MESQDQIGMGTVVAEGEMREMQARLELWATRLLGMRNDAIDAADDALALVLADAGEAVLAALDYVAARVSGRADPWPEAA